MSALSGIKVLDLTDERAIYGAKLMADLGADVVRPEPPGGDPLRARGPHWEDAGSLSSLYYAFFGTNRRSFELDPNSEGAVEQFRALRARADIVVHTAGHFTDALCDPSARDDGQVLVGVTSFGDDGPWRDYLAPDLVAGALAGHAAATGDADTPPLKPFGELNFMISGIYAGIAALSAWLVRDQTGSGQRVGVSVHECIASCLEQVFMFYWYHEVMQRPEGAVLPRRGSTHWSNAFTVMNGTNGSIMITPTPDFDRQLAWLIEEDAHGDLMEEKYQDPDNLPLLIGRTMELLAQWVSQQDVEDLFYRAQDRHIPYGWVQPLDRVGDNAQLNGRGWFTESKLGDATLKAPGTPYHFSRSAWQSGQVDEPGSDTEAVLADIGWSAP